MTLHPDDTAAAADVQFQSLFACLPDAALIVDENHVCLQANAAALRLFELPASRICGRSLDDICGYPRLVEGFSADPNVPARLTGACVICPGEDITRHVECSLCAGFLPGRHLFLLRDVSKTKRTEMALRESEKRFHTFMDNSPLMAIVKDADGHYLYFNKTVEHMVGATLDELRGKSNFHRLPYNIARQLRDNDLEVMRSGRSSEFVEPIPTPDGQIHQWLTNKFPIQDSVGHQMIGMVAFDITDRLATETSLRESEERYRSLFEFSPLPMWVVDVETQRFLAVNRAAIENYGYSETEFLTRTVRDIRLTENPEELQKIVGEMPSEFAEIIHSSHRKKDGTTLSVEIRRHFLHFNGRDAQLVVAADITERERAAAQLKARTQEILDIWESMTDAFFATDADWRFTEVNSHAARIWRMNRDDLVGKKLWHVFPRAMGSVFYHEYHRAMDQQVKVHFEAFYLPLNGWFEIHVYPSPAGISVYFRDVTERRRLDMALRQSEERNRRIVETAQEGIWLVDRDLCTSYVNRRMAEILGYTEDEMMGKAATEFTFPEDNTAVLAHGALRGQPVGYDARYQCKNGDAVWLHINSQPIYEEDAFAGAFGMCTDITDRKLAGEERDLLLEQVSAGREKLQVLSRRLVEVHEIERRNLARELHDEIGQTLTGLKLMLEMNERALARMMQACDGIDATCTLPPKPPRLDKALDLVNGLMQQVRELSLTLRPTMLDDLGLLPTLLWHFERYESQTQVRVTFGHANLEGRFAPEAETAAYRIVQEALTNVARYAGVDEVSVRVWADEKVLGIEIRDDGIGFDAASGASPTSSGLNGMRERALLLQGQLDIASAPGEGTRVIGELPLYKPAAEAIERRQDSR